MKDWQIINQRDDREVEVSGDPGARCRDLLNALFFAVGEVDIKIGVGEILLSEGPQPAVVLEPNNGIHRFSATEARWLADLIEVSIYKFPSDAWLSILSDMILAIRHAANVSEAEFAERKADDKFSN